MQSTSNPAFVLGGECWCRQLPHKSSPCHILAPFSLTPVKLPWRPVKPDNPKSCVLASFGIEGAF